MNKSTAKNDASAAKVMINYLGVICCGKAPHTKNFKKHCSKGCGWVCQLCGPNSNHLRYCYSPCTTNFTYCIIHFQPLLMPLIHSWKHSELLIFDPITKARTDLILKTPINLYAESIAVGNRIFVAGGDMSMKLI